MKNYKILARSSVDELASDVTIAINDGWMDVGPPFVYDEEICQAIIKTIADRPTKKCDVDACGKSVFQDGLCAEHHQWKGAI